MDQKERRNYCQEIMNEALVNAELEDVVDLLKTLLLPIVESIEEEQKRQKKSSSILHYKTF